MKYIQTRFFKQLLAGLLGFTCFTTAHGHLMVAQHGTLNFVDDSVYLVLSLRAAAFGAADKDGDGQLSINEFTQARKTLTDMVAENVSLTGKDGRRPLQGIMISPVTPHDSPDMPADQLIVMGRFTIKDNNEQLRFHVGLYGDRSAEQSLEITATHKAGNRKDVFTLSPESSHRTLFAAQK